MYSMICCGNKLSSYNQILVMFRLFTADVVLRSNQYCDNTTKKTFSHRRKLQKSFLNSLSFVKWFISVAKENWKCHNYFSLWKHTRISRSRKEFSWLTIECTFEKDRGENTEILSCRKSKKPSWRLCVVKRWAFVNRVNTNYKGNVLWFPLGRTV